MQSHKAREDKIRRNPRATKVGEILKEVKEGRLRGACDEKRGGLCRKEGDGNISGREEE